MIKRIAALYQEPAIFLSGDESRAARASSSQSSQLSCPLAFQLRVAQPVNSLLLLSRKHVPLLSAASLYRTIQRVISWRCWWSILDHVD
jgi:hypothetical protein